MLPEKHSCHYNEEGIHQWDRPKISEKLWIQTACSQWVIGSWTLVSKNYYYYYYYRRQKVCSRGNHSSCLFKSDFWTLNTQFLHNDEKTLQFQSITSPSNDGRLCVHHLQDVVTGHMLRDLRKYSFLFHMKAVHSYKMNNIHLQLCLKIILVLLDFFIISSKDIWSITRMVTTWITFF